MRRHLHRAAFAASHRRARGTNGGAVQVSNLPSSGEYHTTKLTSRT
ncbi:MAG: hypothetical protein PVJ21_00340 [Anaerolineales bacterium]